MQGETSFVAFRLGYSGVKLYSTTEYNFYRAAWNADAV